RENATASGPIDVRRENRARGGNDDKARQDGSQRGQPPWTLVRRFLARNEPDKEADGRKPDLVGSRRRETQQPPDHGQQCKRPQCVHVVKADRTEYRHCSIRSPLRQRRRDGRTKGRTAQGSRSGRTCRYGERSWSSQVAARVRATD